MLIIEDMAQKAGHHEVKHRYFDLHGIDWMRQPLPVGDYILSNPKVYDVIDRKQKRNIPIKKMDFLGAYSVCVDSKYSIQEIVTDVCGPQHARFRDELVLAQNNRIKVFVLIDNRDGVTCIDDLNDWINPRSKILTLDKAAEPLAYTSTGKPIYRKKSKYPNATKGEQLAKALRTMETKYGCTFCFCTPEESGAEIVRLLTDKQ